MGRRSRFGRAGVVPAGPPRAQRHRIPLRRCGRIEGRTGTQPPLRRAVLRDRGRRPACARTGLCRRRLRGVAPPAAAAHPLPGPCPTATALVATPAVEALGRATVRPPATRPRNGPPLPRPPRLRQDTASFPPPTGH